MKLKILKIEESSSLHGGSYCFIIFENGYHTYAYKKMRNYKNWKPVVDKFFQGKEVVLDGLRERSKNQIDADSRFTILPDKINAEQMKLSDMLSDSKLGGEI